MADSSAVDAALVALLSADPALAALCPDGVYWGVAPPDKTAFVIVSQVEHEDAYVLGNGTTWERFVYLVKAVTTGTAGSATVARDAAGRIQQLLQDTPVLAVGYHPSSACYRLFRLRPDPEIDEVTDARWFHRGGHYELLITAT